MVMKPKLGVVAVLALSAIAFTGVLATPRASEGIIAESTCSAKQLYAAAAKLHRKLNCYGNLVKEGGSNSTAPGTDLEKCLAKAEKEFEEDFDKATEAEDCLSSVSDWSLENEVDIAVECIVNCVRFNECNCSTDSC